MSTDQQADRGEPTYDQLLAAMELFADDEAFFARNQDGEIVLVLMLNDYFAPAADGEVIPWSEVEELRDRIREGGWYEGVKWAADKRGIEPKHWREKYDG